MEFKNVREVLPVVLPDILPDVLPIIGVNAVDVIEDTTHKFASDTEKSVWNGKQDPLGFTPVSTNDPRLTDARIPLSHIHTNDHAPGSDNQDLSGLQPKETGKGLSTNDYTDAEEEKLSGIEAEANKYIHPVNHPASMITQDSGNRFVADVEKTAWSSKEPGNANIQAHVISAHAPANAQKNSDITKAEIEAKLTGEISTHTHAGGGGGLGYTINVQALTSSPTDGQTVYFGILPKAPTTTANISKVYIRKAGTIKIAEIYCYSGTAGTAEAWSLYIRKNNSADTLIATLSMAASERVFTNSALIIPVAAGDYIEIKGIQPTWATNPLTTIYGGYLYIE
jgi:hypothetical protein